MQYPPGSAPQHPLLQDLVNNGYGHFARHALTERKAAGLPPYVSQFVIRAEATDSAQAYNFLNTCRQIVNQQSQDVSIEVAGPFPSLIEKRQGRFRFMLVCGHAKRAPLHHVLRQALPYIQAQILATKVRWSIDIDPTDFS